MTVYADYEFYSTDYLGTEITSTAFPQLALRASAVIDRITFDRASAIIEDDEDEDTIELIQLATCAIADVMQSQSTIEKEVSSEKVGNHSVTYVVNKDMEKTNTEKQVDAARLYLWNTGLMFQGFDEDDNEYGRHIIR